MQNLKLLFVFQSLNENQKKEIIDLWIRNGVLNQKQAKERVNQVSIVILDKETIVGVSTIYVQDFIIPNNPYFFFRMFIEEKHRGSNSLRTKVMQLNFQKLKEIYSAKVHGIVLELENEKLAKLGQKTNYMTKRGYTYYGKSPRGLQLWYVRFDDPKGIFLNN